jgi:hypothetical protein
MRGQGRPAGEGELVRARRGIGMQAGCQLGANLAHEIAYPRWGVLLGVLGIIFTTDREKTLDNWLGKVERLNSRLFAEPSAAVLPKGDD